MLPLRIKRPQADAGVSCVKPRRSARKLRQAAQFHEISVGLDPKLGYSSLRLRRIFLTSPKEWPFFFGAALISMTDKRTGRTGCRFRVAHRSARSNDPDGLHDGWASFRVRGPRTRSFVGHPRRHCRSEAAGKASRSPRSVGKRQARFGTSPCRSQQS
jgi:hypothetical protein